MKIVINTDYGGFGLNDSALALYNQRSGKSIEHDWQIERNDPFLVQLVEELGEAANGRYGDLKVVEIPDDVEWEIKEYDGNEWIAEKHRTWS
jgi:hypothetical protein